MPAASPPARYQQGMAYDSARSVSALFGGCVPTANTLNPSDGPDCIIPNSLLSDTWEWNGNQWTQMTTGAVPRRSVFGMDFDSVRNVTLIFGGVTDTGATAGGTNDTWEWNGATWTQLSPAVNPIARGGVQMAYDSKRSETVIFGGGGVALLTQPPLAGAFTARSSADTTVSTVTTTGSTSIPWGVITT